MNFLKRCPPVAIAIILSAFACSFLCCTSGNNNTATYHSPTGYNFSNPVIINLRSDLDEISGINYYAKDTSIFAVNDEQGSLYKIHLKDPIKIEHWKFSSQGDFEDILLYDTTFFALQSNGDLKAVTFSKSRSLTTDDCKLPMQEGNNEFETIYYDSYSSNIVLLCKDCEADKHKVISAYSFNPLDQNFLKKSTYQLDEKQISMMLDLKKIRFKPSAAAIHPLTKELYIVSAVATALVIADTKGNIKSAYKLNPKFFKQPEGLTFSPSGNLFISNEAAETGTGNILVFKYKPVDE